MGMGSMPGAGTASDASSSGGTTSGSSQSLTPQQAQAIAALLQNLGKQGMTPGGMGMQSQSQQPAIQAPVGGQFINTARIAQ